jgi:hypothetical protein
MTNCSYQNKTRVKKRSNPEQQYISSYEQTHSNRVWILIQKLLVKSIDILSKDVGPFIRIPTKVVLHFSDFSTFLYDFSKEPEALDQKVKNLRIYF